MSATYDQLIANVEILRNRQASADVMAEVFDDLLKATDGCDCDRCERARKAIADYRTARNHGTPGSSSV